MGKTAELGDEAESGAEPQSVARAELKNELVLWVASQNRYSYP